ncbi:MAG TPA: hypothetical protein VKZ85_12910 [Woeseiaceae bacterium]|nr:hypothetical protein [Woeseiaceae bacterium]
MRTKTLLPAALAASLLAVACDSRSDEPADIQKGLVPVDDAAPAASVPAPGPALGVAAPAPPAAGVPLETGRQYAAGTRVESTADGVSFVVPDEWLGGLPPGAAAFMFGSNTRAGLGLAIMRGATSWQEIELFLNQPQDLGDGVVLYPSSSGQRTARGYEIGFANAMYAGHAIGRLGPGGNGIVVFFGGPAGDRDYYVGLAARTADSVAFGTPRASAAVGQWQGYLAGMMLKRMDSYYSGSYDGSYVGGSSSETLHLCSDGSYAYYSSSSVAADGGAGTTGYGAGGAADTGRWSVETMGDRVLLTLQSHSGEFSQHAVEVRGEATYVDGERAYRVQSDRCR